LNNKTPDSMSEQPLPSGVPGLDGVLAGGFTPGRIYVIDGQPGSGKTTLALQFLIAGVQAGETTMFIALAESRPELESIARSHGWSLAGIRMHEVVPSKESLASEQQYSVFHPFEIELGLLTDRIYDAIRTVAPTRVVIDSLAELRVIAGAPLQYRRQMLVLKQFFAGQGCTVLLLDDEDAEFGVHSLAHGAIRLDRVQPDFGRERRRLLVLKYRGVRFEGGYHDYIVQRGGLKVYPRLIARAHPQLAPAALLPTGIAELDRLLGGGLGRGVSTLVTGAPGTGKSSLAAQVVATSARAGHRAAMFLFDETRETLLARAAALGLDLQALTDSGQVSITHLHPAEVSPGEFGNLLAREVLERDAAVVVIDSLSGYLQAMPGERFLTAQLHELLTFLSYRQVATILIAVQHGLVGTQMSSSVDASYLADAIILLRYFEAFGEVRQAISIVKSRATDHERTIREFQIARGRIRVGEPLRHFQGVLTGVPTYSGEAGPLLGDYRRQIEGSD
jgi:circadian clock protein KaiC